MSNSGDNSIHRRAVKRMVRVESSMIAAVGFANNKLYVVFNNGTTYSYADVPVTLVAKLLRAKSKGKFFNQYVKGKYPCTKENL